MRRIGLGAQLGLAFAIVAASTALLVAAVMSVTWQGIFESYVRERVQESASTFANMAGTSFVTYGRWDNRGLLRLASAARSYSLRAQVLDAHGFVLADSFYLTGEPPLPGVSGGAQSALPASGTLAPMEEPVVTAPVYVD